MHDRIEQSEIEKWLAKLEPLAATIQTVDERGENALTNMKAYISDSKHFLEKGDLVRSFEAMIWAWALFELGTDLGIFTTEQ